MDDSWIEIPNIRICPKCKGLVGMDVECLCMGTDTAKVQDERGDEHMRDLKFPCPFCGQSHLMILGATVVTDKNGSLVAVCPNSNTREVNNGN